MASVIRNHCAQTRCCCRNISSSSSYGPEHAQFGPIQFRLSREPSPDSILWPSNLNSCLKRLHGGCLPFPAWLCGCLEMESYEEFCVRSLVRLHESGEAKKTCESRRFPKTHSVIRFHGRAVLSPLVRKKTLKMWKSQSFSPSESLNVCAT